MEASAQSLVADKKMINTDYMKSRLKLPGILVFLLATTAGANCWANPVTNNDNYSTDEDSPLIVPAPGVLVNDVGGVSHQVYAINLTPGFTPGVQGTANSGATFTLNYDGSFVYDPNGLFESLATGESVVDNIGGFTTQYITEDATGQSGVADINVTVSGVNDSPVIGGTATGSIIEDDVVSISSTLTITDVDNGEGGFQVEILTGTYGSLAIASTAGAWTYTIDNTDGSASDLLNAGAVVTDVFTINTDDNNGSAGATTTISITVTGANDAPLFSGTNAGSMTEDTVSSISGALTITDADTGEGVFITGAQAGTYGSLEVTNTAGSWTYSIDNNNGSATDRLYAGEVVADSFIINTGDSNGSGATTTITITITGANDAPIIGDQNVSIDENSVSDVYLTDLAVTDVDTGDSFTYAIIAGLSSPAEFRVNSSGELVVGSNTPDQELLNFESSPVYSLTVEVTDSGGLTDTATIVVNLNDVEDAPGATVCEEYDSDGNSLDVLPIYLAPLKNFYTFSASTPCHRVISTTDDYYMDQDLKLVATSIVPSPANTGTLNYRISLGDISKSWDQDSSTLYYTSPQSNLAVPGTTSLLSTVVFTNEAGMVVTTGEFIFEPTDGTNATDDGIDNFVYRVCDDAVDDSEAHCALGVVYVNIAKAAAQAVSNENLIADAEDLSQGPLELPVPAIPNVFLLLDDSESMASDILTDQSEGYYAVGNQTKTYFLPEDGSGRTKYADSENNDPGVGLWRLRSADFNKVYYNPAVTYAKWIGVDNRNNEFVDSNPASAISNPYKTSSAKINLTITRNMPNGDRNVFLAKYYVWTDIDDSVNCPGNVVGVVDGTSPVTSPGGACTEGTLVEIKPASDGGTDTYPRGTNRDDCASSSVCTYTEEIQNFANFYSFSRSRHYTSKNSLGSVVAASENMRIGFGAFGGTNDNINIREMNESSLAGNKGDLLQHIYRNDASSNSTPIRDSLERTGRYFECLNSRTIITSDRTCPILPEPEGNCQQNFSLVVTAGFWNASGPSNDIGNDDGDGDSDWDGGRYADSASQTLADVALHFYERDLSSLANEVPATDRDLQGAAASAFGGSEILPTMHQHMSTFVIAFGVNGSLNVNDVPMDYTEAFSWGDAVTDDEKLNDLIHTSVNGRGDYLNAGNPSELKYALESAFNQFAQAIGTASAVSFNSQEIQEGSLLFRAFYNIQDSTGDLVAVEFDASGSLGDQVWSASAQLDALKTYDTREILSFDPTASNGAGGIAFRSTELNAAQQQALEDDPTDSIASTDPLFAAQILKHVNYLRGDASNERPLGNLRERPLVQGRLGDIVSSTPVYYGAPDRTRRSGQPYPQAELYEVFKKNNENRRALVYVSSNDGMLHGFDADDGEELFGYVPAQIITGNYSQRIKQLLSINYAHRYTVDLSNAVNDVYLDPDFRSDSSIEDKNWTTVLIGGYRGGGKGYFALDITDPDAITEANADEVVMWEFTDQDDNHPVDGSGTPLLDAEGFEISGLGYTYSTPTIAMSNVSAADGENRWIAVMGNGYNSTSGSAVLFGLFVDGGTDGNWCHPAKSGCGTLDYDFVQIDTGQTDVSVANGLGIPRLIDMDGNGTVDLAYAGDRFGNMHRFDLRDPNPANWDSQVIFQAKYYNAVTALDEAQPITTQPLIVKHPTVSSGANCYTFDATETRVDRLCGGYLVIFASGSYIFEGDDVSESIQSIYGIWDTVGSTVVTKSGLVEQTYTSIANDDNVGDVRVLSKNPVDYATDLGWYIDFDHPGTTGSDPQFPGERAIRNIQTRGGIVFVNSVIPKQKLSCTVEAGGAANAFCPATGSLVCAIAGVFDLNNDDVFNDADRTTGGAVVASTFFEDAVPTDATFMGGNRVTQLSDKSLEIRATDTSRGENTGRTSWERLKNN